MRILKDATFFSLFVVLLLSGCQVTGSISDANREELESVFLQTHLGEVESDIASASRAAVPYYGGIDSGSLAIPTASPVTVANYPEYGQSSVYAILATATANVYKVSVTTTYPDWSVRATASEVYYIRDNPKTGAIYNTYGIEDEILAANLSDVDSFYRETMQTAYRSAFGGEDSIRYETIADDGAHTLSLLASIPTTGSMVYDTVAASTFPADTTGNAHWSSKVTYTQSNVGTSNVVAALLGFSLFATYATAGTRYYTEVTDLSMSGYDQLNSTIWFEETKADGALVARTVTRETYYMNTTDQRRSAKDVRTRSVLYDSTGRKNMQLEKAGYGASSLSFY